MKDGITLNVSVHGQVIVQDTFVASRPVSSV